MWSDGSLMYALADTPPPSQMLTKLRGIGRNIWQEIQEQELPKSRGQGKQYPGVSRSPKNAVRATTDFASQRRGVPTS